MIPVPHNATAATPKLAFPLLLVNSKIIIITYDGNIKVLDQRK